MGIVSSFMLMCLPLLCYINYTLCLSSLIVSSWLVSPLLPYYPPPLFLFILSLIANFPWVVVPVYSALSLFIWKLPVQRISHIFLCFLVRLHLFTWLKLVLKCALCMEHQCCGVLTQRFQHITDIHFCTPFLFLYAEQPAGITAPQCLILECKHTFHN